MGKLSGAVLAGFSRMFPTGDSVAAPAEIDLGSIQPVADVSELAAYNASPGLFDGWWILSEGVTEVGGGYAFSNKNPFLSNNLPPRAPAGGWRIWVYGAWATFAAGTPADLVQANISYAQSSTVWKIDLSGPSAEFLLWSGSIVRKTTAGYGYIVGDPLPHVMPFPIYDIGPANNIMFVVENGGVGNITVNFSMLLRLLPPNVRP